MNTLSQTILLRAIRVYQHTLSPDHGPFRFLFPLGVCRYPQTCSEFTYQAIKSDGARGLWRGLKRLATCHPFSSHDYGSIVVNPKKLIS